MKQDSNTFFFPFFFLNNISRNTTVYVLWLYCLFKQTEYITFGWETGEKKCDQRLQILLIFPEIKWRLEDYLPRNQRFQPSQPRFLTTTPSSDTSNPRASSAFPILSSPQLPLLWKHTPLTSIYFLQPFLDFLLAIDTLLPPSLRAIILVAITELLQQPGSSGVLSRLCPIRVWKKK